MRDASWPEGHTAGRRREQLPAGLEPELPVQHEPQFVLATVLVKGRTLLGANDQLDHGERPVGLLRSGLDTAVSPVGVFRTIPSAA